MRVVDTSLWVEYLGDGLLTKWAGSCMKPLSSCVVPAMVHYELAKWCRRNLDSDNMKLALSLLTECRNVPMNEAVAVEAAELSLKHNLHATDAIIYATARLTEAKLFTCDAHFKDLPGVEFRPKEN